MLITFSGLDGAGKSTLISRLKAALEKRNRRVTVLAMYYHVGPYAFIRFVRDWIKRCTGQEGKQQAGMNRVSSDPDQLGFQVARHGWLSRIILGAARNSTVKRFVCIFDLCNFLLYWIYFEKVKNHVLIMDRYFYDSLADVADGNRWFYIQLFLLFIPTPDLPIFVDVSPEEAFARKGEYPVEYMMRRYSNYQEIFKWVHNPVFIPNDDLEQTTRRIEDTVLGYLNSRQDCEGKKASG
jgi:thymidylate kinase